MNGRERIMEALSHREPDGIPFDLAGSTWTGITNGAYQKLRHQLGFSPDEPEWADVIQQIVVPSTDILDLLDIDTRGLFPLTSHNWNVHSSLSDIGDRWEYNDEWGFRHHFPKENGYWFSLVGHPMENSVPDNALVDNYNWPDPSDPARIAGLREKAVRFREEGKLVMLKGLCAGIFEMQQRIRGVSNAMVDSFLYPEFSDRLIGKLADLKIQFWQSALSELADVVDVVAEADDYGTQESQLIAPDHFRQYYKPHISRIINVIRESAPNAKIMFHSCGNIRPIIPDFIEMGINIINPVHINAEGMEPYQLKKDFGKDLVFWGGGVDTQEVLPAGSPSEVSDDVKRNIDALAPGGGFVFSTVHNIQAEVPAPNIIAMLKAIGRM
jgi:uroporphyrinogen decarboxylase